jgi:periplasmic copper chaperone A
MRRRFALTTLIATAVVVGALVAPAFAHVSVTPEQAAKGSTATLTFRVPNEKDGATTTKVEIFLPEDHPVTTLTAQPVDGWTEATSGTASASWTADAGAGIPPDGAQSFVITVGPLPSDSDSYVFKALQTYSDGEVVRWIELTPPGGPEPDLPAPTLTLTGPIVTTTSAPPTTVASSTETSAAPPTTAATSAAASESDGGGGNGALVAVIIAAVVALLAAAYALSRRRRGTGRP